MSIVTTYYSSVDGFYSQRTNLLILYPASKNWDEYLIPDTVTDIGYRAFNVSENLSSVIIPESVSVIEDYAFMACSNLVTITNRYIGNQYIGYAAFETSVNVSGDNYAFAYSDNTNFIDAVEIEGYEVILLDEDSGDGGDGDEDFISAAINAGYPIIRLWTR